MAVREKKREQVKKQTNKKLLAKDGYLYEGQSVYINVADVQLLQDSRDSTLKKSKTG